MSVEEKAVSIVGEKYLLGYEFYRNQGMKSFFQIKREQYKYMCIFGAGVLGTTLCRWLKNNGIEVDYFCDNNRDRDSARIMDIPYITFEELEEIKNDVYVMVSVTNKGCGKKYNEEINNQLKGFPNVMPNILQFIGFYTNDYKLNYDICIKYVEKIVSTLEDNMSKELFLENLKYKFISDGEPVSYNTLEKFYSPVQYFSEEYYKNTSDAVIVDCGAYKGDTLLEYINLFGDEFTEYHCFEMDVEALEKLKVNVSKLPLKIKSKVKIHPYGVYKERGEAYYDISTETLASCISETGQMKAKLISLDEELYENRVTMINMDIEGSELSALQGADKIIKRCKPMLAISIYHSTEQFLGVPFYLMNKYPFYKYYMGLHTTITDDCVLYAVPK